MTPLQINHPVILFDGVCNLCNGAVQFIIRRDPGAYFRFASLQSSFGQQVLEKHGLNQNVFHSILVYTDGKLLDESDAAFFIAGHLKGWRWVTIFKILPRSVTNFLYRVISRNRYRFFGKQNECMIPTVELRSRFL